MRFLIELTKNLISGSVPPIRLSRADYNMFPGDFDITNKVWRYYCERTLFLHWLGGLNQSQLLLCMDFGCGGLIDNGGMFSLLIETKGRYSKPYETSLKASGSFESAEIMGRIDEIYEIYRRDLSKKRLPGVLDEESDAFDSGLNSEIELLEEKWFKLSNEREVNLKSFLEKNRDFVISVA